MSYDWGALASVGGAFIASGVTLIGLLRTPGRLHTKLHHDVDVLSKLNAQSASGRRMQVVVDRQIERLWTLETTRTERRWVALFAALAAFFAYWLINAIQDEGNWYAIALIATMLLLQALGAWLFGTRTDWRIPVDAHGRRVKPPRA